MSSDGGATARGNGAVGEATASASRHGSYTNLSISSSAVDSAAASSGGSGSRAGVGAGAGARARVVVEEGAGAGGVGRGDGGSVKKLSLAQRRMKFSLAPSLSMDYNVSKILPFLFLGGQEVTTEKAMMKSLNISHIVSLCSESRPHFPEDFVYLNLGIADSPQANILKVLEPSFEAINAAKNAGGCCLVHCQVGMSRSSAVVLAYLLKHAETPTLFDAFARIKKLRPVTAPNIGFMEQLVDYEQSLRGSISFHIEAYRLNRFDDVAKFQR